MCVSQYLTELWIFEQNYAHWAHCAGGDILWYPRNTSHNNQGKSYISGEKTSLKYVIQKGKVTPHHLASDNKLQIVFMTQGGKVLSPWNISPRITLGWVGVWDKNEELPKGTNSGIFMSHGCLGQK